jgi:hypothetical protein
MEDVMVSGPIAPINTTQTTAIQYTVTFTFMDSKLGDKDS